MGSDRRPARVSWRQIHAFRLRRHHLDSRSPRGTEVEVVEDVGGLQAQVLSAAELALWTRVRGYRKGMLQRSLDRDRTLVRASAMRSTLYLLPADTLAVYARGCRDRAERELVWARGKGYSIEELASLIDSTLGCLDHPITRERLADAVASKLGVPRQGSPAGGWGNPRLVPGIKFGSITWPVSYVLQLAASKGVICRGPSLGGTPTFVRADRWLPSWKDLSVVEAEDRLVRSFLRAFGPASPADFAYWTGNRLRHALAVWGRALSSMVTVTVGDRELFVLEEDLDVLTSSRLVNAPVRLLPTFDSYLLGAREKQHLVHVAHHKRVYRSQGWVSSVVLIGGQIRGLWDIRSPGNRSSVQIRPLGSMTSAQLRNAAAEGERVAQFLASVTTGPTRD